ncbi:carboxypeptidase B-like isoform X3 [Antedon mediterranea]|uniref:carboxypeptidase B-like isoform X3 n=1 Tax=Antedon mediterranea TaxID=105859 RepID=UPI003AF62DC9
MKVYCQWVLYITAMLVFLRGARSKEEGVQTISRHRFIRVVPSSVEHVITLTTLEEAYGENKVIFLRSAGILDTPVDIVLNDHSFDSFTDDLKSADIPYIVENVEETLIEKIRKRRDVSVEDEFDHTRYHFYNEMIDWLRILEKRYENIASMFTIGRTFEGRDMYVMKITSNVRDENEKSGIWIEGGIHAREKISPATMVFIIQQLLEEYGNDDVVTELVDGLIWYILPVVNIDGYEFSMKPLENATTIRQFFKTEADVESEVWKALYWRKTRSVNEGTTCIGVDPNRNWDFKWEALRVNKDTNKTFCLISDPGLKPFSEVEIQNIAKFLMEHSYIDAYLSVHSYGQMIIFPWCWTKDNISDYEDLQNLSDKVSKAIESVNGTKYRSGPVPSLILTGCSCDWTYAVAGIKYSYGIELRDTGTYGFFLPEDQIEPTGIETLEGFKEIGKHLISLDHNETKKDRNDATSINHSSSLLCCFVYLLLLCI